MSIVGTYNSIFPRRKFTKVQTAPPPANDPDAQAFIDAVGTLSTAQEAAVNQLVLDMKTAGVWSKGYAYYPMVGGTATTHKWNLFNPVDSNAAFRGVFHGGWTHNANGAKGNGTNGAMDTFLKPSTSLTAHDASLVYVSKTSGDLNGYEIGMVMNSNIHTMFMWVRGYGALTRSDQYNSTTGQGVLSVSQSDGSGVFVASRTSASSHKIYRNGVVIASNSSSGGALSSCTEPIAVNNVRGTLNRYFAPSSRICAGAGVFQGLSDTEAADLTTAIQTFNTALGR